MPPVSFGTMLRMQCSLNWANASARVKITRDVGCDLHGLELRRTVFSAG